MLRPEMMRRPFGARFKLDAQEIPELAINAVPNSPEELAFGIANPHVGLQRNRLIELKSKRRIRRCLAGCPRSGAGVRLCPSIAHRPCPHTASKVLSACPTYTLLIGEQEAKDYGRLGALLNVRVSRRFGSPSATLQEIETDMRD